MIENARYAEDGSISVVLGGIQIGIPNNPANAEYQRLKEWEAEGNLIAPYLPPPSEPSVPSPVSDRQFFQALAIRGHITEDEALDAVGPGIIPAAMLALIGQLPTDAQFGAKMLIRGATIYERGNDLAGLIGSLYGWDPAALDEFWTFAGTL